MPAHAWRTILTEARGRYPEECCGALLGHAGPDGSHRVLRAVPVGNAREGERERRYLIGAGDVRSLEAEAARSGTALLGFFHSHPDHPAVPSEFDRDHAWPWYSYVIVPVAAGVPGRPRAWRLRDDRSAFAEARLVRADRAAAETMEQEVGE